MARLAGFKSFISKAHSVQAECFFVYLKLEDILEDIIEIFYGLFDGIDKDGDISIMFPVHTSYNRIEISLKRLVST